MLLDDSDENNQHVLVYSRTAFSMWRLSTLSTRAVNLSSRAMENSQGLVKLRKERWI